MAMTLTTGAFLAGMLAGPCPPADDPPLLLDRKALQEIMIHDAHGGNLEGRSILGVILEQPIGLRYAVDGEPLAEGDPDAVMAVDLEAIETAWIVGTDEEATTIHLVRGGSDAPEAGGRCIELMTLPLDSEYIARFEALGGTGTPGMILVSFNNTVVFSWAANLAMTPAQQSARSARITGTLRRPSVQVAAPWLRDHEEYEDHPGLSIARAELRGDAREIFPNR